MANENDNTAQRSEFFFTPEVLERLAIAGLPAAPVWVAGGSPAYGGEDALEKGLWVKAGSRAGQGFCMRVHHPADLPLALSKAKKLGKGAAPLVQAAVEGKAIVLLGRWIEGLFQVLARARVEMTEGMFRIPIAYSTPPDLNPAEHAALDRATAALSELPYTDGAMVAAEIVVSGMGMVLTDLHPMPAACPVFLEALDISFGTEWRRGALPEDSAMALRWLPSPSGQVVTVDGVDAARAMDGVCRVVVNARPGDTLRHATDTTSRDRTGYVIAAGPDGRQAREAARKAVEIIRVETRVAQD